MKNQRGLIALVMTLACCTLTLAQPAPFYRVISPNGGEVYRIGDTVIVKLESDSFGQAGVTLFLGRNSLPLNGLMGYNGSFNPFVNPVSRFVIPDSFLVQSWNATTNTMENTYPKTVSSQCRLFVGKYNQEDQYNDYSDTTFTILPRSTSTLPGNVRGAALKQQPAGSTSNTGCGNGFGLALMIPVWIAGKRFCWKCKKT